MSLARRVITRGLDIIDRKDRIRGIRDYYFRDRWLRYVTNVVHVGANAGQESDRYARRGIGVLWIEPIPAVFAILEKNISRYPNQTARRALVTDRSGAIVSFNVSANHGQSSSVFEMDKHRDLWPEVTYDSQIRLESSTLDDILAEEPRSYNGLVMDTQGAELLVLKGAKRSIDRFIAIKTEAANCALYKGSPTDRDLSDFLKPYGFVLKTKETIKRGLSGEEVYDLLFYNIKLHELNS